MSSNVSFKSILESAFIVGSVLLGAALDAHAQADLCPPRYRARLEAVNPVAPEGWDERMRELPQESNAGAPNAELISISNDLSVIRNSPEFKRFQATYKIDPLNLDPKLEPKRLLANATALHGAYVEEAEKACIAIGGFNKRILELQDDTNSALEDYKDDEWLYFTGNSLKIVGNVGMYATALGEAATVGKMAIQLVKNTRELRKLELRVAELWRTVRPSRLIKLKRRDQVLDIWQSDEFKKLVLESYLPTQKLHFQNALREAGWTLPLEVVVKAGQVESSYWKANREATSVEPSIPDLTTEVVLGGDVWKQFQGFVNPYEEMINLNLEQKKKWVGIYQQNQSQAQALKGKIEALMKKIVPMESQPAPPGIGYQGFTIYREGGS